MGRGLHGVHPGRLSGGELPDGEALSLARATGDREGAGWALHGLGRVANQWGDSGKAAALLEESAELFRQAGNRRGHAYSQAFLAGVVQHQDVERAATLFEESLATLRSLGDTWGLCGVTGLCADFTLLQGDLERAATLCDESLAHARALGGQWMISYAIWRFACIAIAAGDDERGALLYAAAQTVSDTIGVPPLPESRAALELARARMDADRFAAAWAAGGGLTLDGAITEALTAAAALAAPAGLSSPTSTSTPRP